MKKDMQFKVEGTCCDLCDIAKQPPFDWGGCSNPKCANCHQVSQQGEPECRHCGLLKSTVESIDTRCVQTGDDTFLIHDFGATPTPAPREKGEWERKLREEFEKAHGIYKWSANSDPTSRALGKSANWWLSKISSLLAAAREKAIKEGRTDAIRQMREGALILILLIGLYIWFGISHHS